MEGITRNELSVLLKVSLLTVINWESTGKINRLDSDGKNVVYCFKSVNKHIANVQKKYFEKSKNFLEAIDSLKLIEKKQIESEKLFKENLDKYNKSIIK